MEDIVAAFHIAVERKEDSDSWKEDRDFGVLAGNYEKRLKAIEKLLKNYIDNTERSWR